MAETKQIDPADAAVTQTLSRLCLDFRTGAKRYRAALEKFLLAHRQQLDLGEEQDLVQAYVERVWPNGLPGTAILSNISLGLTPRYLIRPPVDGPLAAHYAANGRAPALHVYPQRGVLVVVQFETAPHVPPRSFEAQFTAPTFINPVGLSMSPADLAALDALPKRRQQTEEFLAPYRDLIDWQEETARRGQCALRYDGVEFVSERHARFQVTTHMPARALRYRLARTAMVVVPFSASSSTTE